MKIKINKIASILVVIAILFACCTSSNTNLTESVSEKEISSQNDVSTKNTDIETFWTKIEGISNSKKLLSNLPSLYNNSPELRLLNIGKTHLIGNLPVGSEEEDYFFSQVLISNNNIDELLIEQLKALKNLQYKIVYDIEGYNGDVTEWMSEELFFLVDEVISMDTRNKDILIEKYLDGFLNLFDATDGILIKSIPNKISYEEIEKNWQKYVDISKLNKVTRKFDIDDAKKYVDIQENLHDNYQYHLQRLIDEPHTVIIRFSGSSHSPFQSKFWIIADHKSENEIDVQQIIKFKVIKDLIK